MCIPRPQNLVVEHAVHRDIHRRRRMTRHDRRAERISEAGAAGLSGYIRLGEAKPMDRIVDRAVARAPAQIALERMREVVALLRVQ